MTAVVETSPEVDLDALIRTSCGRCGGTGHLHGFEHVEGGRCFGCGGSGAGEVVTQRILNRRAKDRARRAAKRAAEAEKKLAEVRAAREAYIEANPEIAAALEDIGGDFGASLREALKDYGSLTEAQEKAVVKIAAEKAAEPEPTPVPEGRIEVIGTVKTTKWVDNAYGGSAKMLVLDDRGFKVWGSVPAAINSLEEGGPYAEAGSRVKFVATVESSVDDRTFGFFKRPHGAVLLSDDS